MPGPEITPVHSDPRPPERVDVVVIGGGIIGCATALELAERGQSVLLCEKGQIGAEQSSRNWGWVRLALRDPREIPLMIEAGRLWPTLDARTGQATGYTRSGTLFAAARDADVALRERWARHLEPYEASCRMMSRSEIDGLMPGNRLQIKGALYTPGDGLAEPQWAAPAIAEGARKAGAHIMTGCAVRSVETTAGAVSGVVTEKGVVKCDAAVLAGGVWSRLFAGNAGIELPQLRVLGTVMRTTAAEGPEFPISGDRFSLRKRSDGGYTVARAGANVVDIVPDSFRLGLQFLPALRREWRSLQFRLSRRWPEEARQARAWQPDEITPFEQVRILDPAPSKTIADRNWAAAQQAFPFLANARVAQVWGGMIDATPDAIPVLSAADDLPGLFLATGFSGHGFGIAPGAGRLMADLITGAPPCVDPHAFRLSRFSDGSRVRPWDGR